MIPDQPHPRERSYKVWVVLIGGKEHGKPCSKSEAEDEAREVMFDRGLSSIEVAEKRITTGGTFQNGDEEYLNTITLYENDPVRTQATRPVGLVSNHIRSHTCSHRLRSAH